MNNRTMKYEDLIIDEELESLLPKLSERDYRELEESIIKNGFDKKYSTIKLWVPEGITGIHEYTFIVIDGHNRLKICKELGLVLDINDFEYLEFNSKDEVKEYMYELQLARRNLNVVQRYEVVNKFKDFLQDKARKNQSEGGKGLSDLTKVNVRKELAQRVGISEGSYRKLDIVMKSDDDLLKNRLRNEEISIDKAYKEYTKSQLPVESKSVEVVDEEPEEDKPLTLSEKIAQIDKEIKDVEGEIHALNLDKESLQRDRLKLFEKLVEDGTCELKYRFVSVGYVFCNRTVEFYVEVDGEEKVFLKCKMDMSTPHYGDNKSIPHKYKEDFKSLWEMAWKEEEADQKRLLDELAKEASKNQAKSSNPLSSYSDSKDFYRRCYKLLAKSFHPDAQGSEEDMKMLNELKVAWGI